MRPGSVSMDSKWSYLSMIDRLSNGDITRHDLVYERNYIECLNLLSYWHEKDAYMEEMNRQRQNELKRYGK
jgi:hypothetical protein